MSLAERIRANVAHHNALQEQLLALHNIPSALEKQETSLQDLQKQKRTSDLEAETLSANTAKGRLEHEKLRDSVGRKWMAKLAGKEEQFEEKQTREERKYVESLEKEMQERSQAETLGNLIKEAERTRDNLALTAEEYVRLNKELHELYAELFDGPTEEYPLDDALEENLSKARDSLNKAEAKHKHATSVQELLDEALEEIKRCQIAISEALKSSSKDMWGGDMLLEHSELSNAKYSARSTRKLLDKARTIATEISQCDVDELYIIKHGALPNVDSFQHYFLDSDYHDKIRNDVKTCEQIVPKIEAERNGWLSQSFHLANELGEARFDLTQKQKDLDTFRRKVFEGFQT